EFSALKEQGAWTLVPPIDNMNIVGCKWVFRTKYNPDGSVSYYKARLVAKGFNSWKVWILMKPLVSLLKKTIVMVILALSAFY
ncbi:MAG: hypothetical protein Q8835_03255, partial [Sweet potato little leaf phytoplasma]|nr:hypothetical protein [Sweet potato little leaf phytoplasma]